VEGDDMTEPIADAARGILDGHVMLSRKLAQKAHFPAIDVLDSVSRVADDISPKEHMDARRQVMKTLATYREVEDLVQIGAYAKGSNVEADVAIEYQRAINEMLRQGKDDAEAFEKAYPRFVKLAKETTEAAMRKGKK
jgi:flagellum-specific ATP synthase